MTPRHSSGPWGGRAGLTHAPPPSMSVTRNQWDGCYFCYRGLSRSGQEQMPSTGSPVLFCFPQSPCVTTHDWSSVDTRFWGSQSHSRVTSCQAQRGAGPTKPPLLEACDMAGPRQPLWATCERKES